ncbi:procathepsin L-like [Oppia nitens]|uniref:procathepsin L-like n=1 Tax=Oppia nitens TaxID=1686743 RepID=UPI0023DCE3C0|nr:procathepsin L-like [Oppia nitens]XP_054163591.1 procathepsin L-like [Oppia nitens]
MYNNILVLGLLAIVSTQALAISYRDVIFEEWESFKVKHGKQYTDQSEENFRLKVFMENKHRIAKHNNRAANGLKGYSLAMNQFGDLLSHEFTALMNGFKKSYRTDSYNGSSYLSPHNVMVPASVDWRDKGYVSEVKNQGQCGSCWSFSATGALEGQHYRKYGKMIELSEQNLIDCSHSYGNNGCEGGLMDNAFAYIKDNHGVDTEGSYPYEAKDKKCRYKARNVGATDTGFVDISEGDENKLKEAVATVGPVSVAIDASHESFQFYSKGVYDEAECSSTELDHGVLVVGYGTSPASEDYWIVKNSWGTQWGDEGYIKMTRNKDNQCGIASSASYPLV